MKLYIFTIVLDGMPFLPMQYNILNQLTCDWRWIVVEGAAANVNCTSWCKPQEARVSHDGSFEFMQSLSSNPNILHLYQPWWEGGKVQMCNYALEHIKEPCVLVQIDVDELWDPDQLGKLRFLLMPPGVNHSALFYCRYFVGPNLVTIGENCYGNNPGEWARAWRFEPGMRFVKHEPPVWNKPMPGQIPREVTRSLGLRFDHWAYFFESQVAYKEKFYGYDGAVDDWNELQQYKGPFPVKLNRFLPWVDAGASVVKIRP